MNAIELLDRLLCDLTIDRASSSCHLELSHRICVHTRRRTLKIANLNVVLSTTWNFQFPMPWNLNFSSHIMPSILNITLRRPRYLAKVTFSSFANYLLYLKFFVVFAQTSCDIDAIEADLVNSICSPNWLLSVVQILCKEKKVIDHDDRAKER